jgi:hypothetical protein
MLKCLTLFCLAAIACTAADIAPAPEKVAGFKPKSAIEIRGDYRFISSNGIPDHQPGAFPNPGNPNTISEQKYEFRVPLHPKATATTSHVRGPVLFGVALNGVPFDPGTAEVWNGNFEWRYEALTGGLNLGLDSSNGHVQPGGKYHYHALPTGMIDRISIDKQKMVLVGYAADGFPIYSQYGYNDPNDIKSGVKKMKASFKVKEGDRPAGAPPGKYDGKFAADWEYVKGLGDLDECNGRVGVTPEYPEGTFHYYITEDYPFVPRFFKGETDASFRKNDMGGGPGGPGRRGPGFGPPRGPGFGPPGGPGAGGPPLDGGDAGHPPTRGQMLERAKQLTEEAKRLTDEAEKLKEPAPK